MATTDWIAASNKYLDDATAWSAGAPGSGDTAAFSTNTGGECTVRTSATIAATTCGFNHSITISPGVTLTITGSVGFVSATLSFIIQTGAKLIVQGQTGSKLFCVTGSTGELHLTLANSGCELTFPSTTPLSLVVLSGTSGAGALTFANQQAITDLDVSGVTGAFKIQGASNKGFYIPSGKHLVMPATPSWVQVQSLNSGAGGTIYAPGGTDLTGNTNWVFVLPSYTLTYTAGAHGSITGTTPQTVVEGSDGSTVTAVPATGYHFTSWSDGVLTAARTDLNVHANISVTASFAINTYTLNYMAAPNGSITGSTSQTVNYGANGTAVTAVGNAGYGFVNWDDASTSNPRQDLNVTSNIAVMANFLAIPVVTGGRLAAIRGQGIYYQIIGTNTPTSYNVTGLPTGLTVDTSTGIISGVIPIAGAFSIVLSATNAGGTGTANMVLTSWGIFPERK